MKQKLIYSVLVVACSYLPASSRECGKVCLVTEIKNEVPVVKDKVLVDTEELGSLPISPL